MSETTLVKDPCNIVIIGASGDLARRKVIPALFSLYSNHALPETFRVFGFARSAFTDEEFRDRAMENLTCRYVPGESCEDYMMTFLSRCYYQQGDYGSTDSFLDLYRRIAELGGAGPELPVLHGHSPLGLPGHHKGPG